MTEALRQAVFTEAAFAQARKAVAASLRRSGCILHAGMVDALTATVLEHEVATRRRLVGMVSDFADVYGAECTPDRLKALGTALAEHRVGPNGEPYLDDDA